MNDISHPESTIHRLLGQVRVRIRQAQRRTTELKDVKAVLDVSHRSAAQLVQKRALRIIKKVKDRRNELVRELFKKKVEQYTLLEAEINDTEMYTENMVGVCEQAESLLAMEMQDVHGDLEVQLRAILNQSPSSSQACEISIPRFSPDKMADLRLGEVFTSTTSVSSLPFWPVDNGIYSLANSNDTGHCSDYDSDGSFVEININDVTVNAGEPEPIRISSLDLLGDSYAAIPNAAEPQSIRRISSADLQGSIDMTSLDSIDGCSLTYEEFKKDRKNMVSSDHGSSGCDQKDACSSGSCGSKIGNGFSRTLSKSSPCIPQANTGQEYIHGEKPSAVRRKWSVVADNLGFVKTIADVHHEFDKVPEKKWSLMPNKYEYLDKPRLIFSLTKSGKERGYLNTPYDVVFLTNGNVAVAESNRLQIFDMTGRSIRIIAEDYIKPRNVLVTPNGTIGITDKKDHCVKIFSPEGKLLRSWGKGMFNGPAGLALYGPDKFIVTDVGKNAATIYMHDGRTVKEFGSRGIAANPIKSPSYLTSDSDSNIYLASHYEHCIYMYDPMGEPIRRISKKGSADGKVRNPRGITVDRNGHILVADSFNDRLSVFGRDGYFVRNILVKENSVTDPGGVSVSSQHGYLAFTENGYRDKLKVYQIYKT